jgi:hypothetical protein
MNARQWLLAGAALSFLALSAPMSSAAPSAPPANVSPPTIDGRAQEGQTLTADAGTWRGTEPITFGIRWLRCNVGGSDCAPIAGATRATYKLVSADVGQTIRVEITGANSEGRETARSRQAATVRPAPANAPVNTSAPTISGTPLERELLRGDAGEWSGTKPFDLNFQWQRTPAGYVVRRALVFVIPLPYGWVTQPAEVPTEQDGWATVTMRATPSLPRRGAIVMFVRARRPGDFVLTGVSTRRLVQMLVLLP